MAKSELHRDYILELESELQEFEKKADATTKRMQMLVYPAMVAFFILSAFGFFLIYSLTSDVERMADTFTHMSTSIEKNMDSMTGNIDHLTKDIGTMTSTTSNMSDSISGMKPAIYDMAASTNNMQRDFWSMNKNISTPLSFMNSFLPWKDSQSMPFQGSQAPLPRSQFSPPVYQQPPTYGGMNAPVQTVPMPSYIPPIPLDIPAPQPQMQQQVIDGVQGSVVDSLSPALIGTASVN
jgi:hypothetical protein